MADYLETVDPQNYHAADRAKTIQHLNDILAGRSKESLTPLISTSTEETPVRLMADFAALSAQIEQMAQPLSAPAWPERGSTRYGMTARKHR